MMTEEQLKKCRDENISLWYFTIEFSRKSYRCTKIDRPVEVLVDHWDENNDYSLRLVRKINKHYTYRGLNIHYFLQHLYETREECVEAYNSEILNQKDKLQHDYEERLKYLDSKLEKL